MCTAYNIGFEDDEWEEYCLSGKRLGEVKYCFTPLFVSKMTARIFKKEVDAIKEELSKSTKLRRDTEEITRSITAWLKKKEGKK